MHNMCCDAMRYHTANHCPDHNSPFECPDWLVYYSEQRNVFGIVIHDGGESYIKIRYCPWCGSALPTEPENEEADQASEINSLNDVCCEDMRNWSSDHCPVHPCECPDRLMLFDKKDDNYGIIIHDGGGSYVEIRYCPWCGKALPAKPEDGETEDASEE